LGYFGKLIVIFGENEVAQRNGNILGNFLLEQILTFSSKWWFLVSILRFQEWFDVDIFDSQIEL
jgi:hypothetical protein